jgi:glycerol-3-phosphate dehydrogenase
VGLRPLVKPPQEGEEDTKGLSREHTVLVSRSGLVTVTGGKWTTYRAMAEDVLQKCMDETLLPSKAGGASTHLLLVGAQGQRGAARPLSAVPGLSVYGNEAGAVSCLPGAQRQLGGGVTEAMVRFAVRHEYARTVEDVLARRSRLLFLDARLAGEIASEVGAIVGEETGRDPEVAAFEALARKYLELPVQ